MDNFAKYLTPEEAKKIDDSTPNGRREPIEFYYALSQNDGVCEVCGQPVWKFADTGLCFSCTTGESDASDDYEII